MEFGKDGHHPSSKEDAAYREVYSRYMKARANVVKHLKCPMNLREVLSAKFGPSSPGIAATPLSSR